MAFNMRGPEFEKCMEGVRADARKWWDEHYAKPENAARLAKAWAEYERQRALDALIGQSI